MSRLMIIDLSNRRGAYINMISFGTVHSSKVWGEMETVGQLITPHIDIVTQIGEAQQNPEMISNCLIYGRCM